MFGTPIIPHTDGGYPGSIPNPYSPNPWGPPPIMPFNTAGAFPLQIQMAPPKAIPSFSEGDQEVAHCFIELFEKGTSGFTERQNLTVSVNTWMDQQQIGSALMNRLKKVPFMIHLDRK